MLHSIACPGARACNVPSSLPTLACLVPIHIPPLPDHVCWCALLAGSLPVWPVKLAGAACLPSVASAQLAAYLARFFG